MENKPLQDEVAAVLDSTSSAFAEAVANFCGGLDGEMATYGVFRAVISQRDPGVANWLDPGGREIGLISGRYFQSDNAPVPKLTKLPLAQLSRFLPDDTVRIDRKQRAENLRGRWRSAHRRMCSDQED